MNESAIPTRRGKLWHPLGVKRTLTNRAYTGVQFYGEKRWTLVKGVNKDGQAFRKQIATDRPESEWVRIEGFTPQIISPPLFAQVQERLSTRQAMVRKPKMRYLLTGFFVAASAERPSAGPLCSVSIGITVAAPPTPQRRLRRRAVSSISGLTPWNPWSGVSSSPRLRIHRF